MSDSKSIDKQGKRVKELTKKIKEKTYTLEEVHELSELLYDMGEKVAVMKYLMAKNDFHPVEAEEIESSSSAIEKESPETPEMPVNVIEEKEEEPEIEEEAAEDKPAFSFSLFDSEPDQNEVSKEEVSEKIEPEDEEIPEEPSNVEESQQEPEKPISENTSGLNAAIEERKGGGSLNDNYFGQEDNSLASKLKNTPIQNLKSAIGINVKFSFINDLFDGNADDFNQSVEAIDLMKNADEARELLGELSGKHNWDLESHTVSQFVEMVERRFM